MTPEPGFAARMQELERPAPAGRIGVAVSGGGDSLALLCLAVDWANRNGREVLAVTVDHGLRPEAAGEAAHVVALCRAAGVPCDMLTWTGWDGQGNLQDAARRARKSLIASWAARSAVTLVLTGHTQDDQAETVLMRLARGSGVDGLAGIAPWTRDAGLVWGRPLLDTRRQELRSYLTARGMSWVEDPSNDDPRFDRVKARKMLGSLAELGLTVDRLAATAKRMQAAADALARATGDLALQAVSVDRGDLVIDDAAVRAAPEDVQRRLMARALSWVAGQTYRPRYEALLALMQSCAKGGSGTLHGCFVKPNRAGGLRVMRELKAVSGLVAAPGEPWDGRWHLDGRGSPGDSVRATAGRCSIWMDGAQRVCLGKA